MEAARLQAIIETDTSKGEAGIKSFGSKVEEAGGKVGGFIKNIGGIALGMGAFSLVAGGISLVKDNLFDMVKSGMDANATAAQTAAVLKSTHGAAGVTASSVENLSNKLMNLTGIDDDTVTSTQNMLLTFTNIGSKGGVFDQATQTALDMSTALGQDTKSSAIQLGKALNDPLTGITALQRVGVTFNQGQKDQIATMMKHGDVAGAQGVILKELNKEFGGSAEAAGKANGGIKILGAQFDNMKQSIGQAVIPIIGKLVNAVSPLVAQFAANLPGAIDTASKFFTANILPVIKQFGGFIMTDVVPAVKQFAGFVLTQVVPAIGQLAQWFETKILPAIEKFAGFVVKNVVPALENLFTWAKKNVLPVIQELAEVFVNDVLPALEGIWGHIQQKLIPAVERLWEKIEPGVKTVLPILGDVLKNVVGPAIGGVIDLASKLIDAIGTIVDKVGGALGKLGQFKDLIGNGLGGLGNALGLGGHAAGTNFHQGGPFIGAERGPELLLTPGIYTAPRGSTVLNASDTRTAMAGGFGGTHQTINIYPQKADLNAADLSRHLRRVALHASTGGAY